MLSLKPEESRERCSNDIGLYDLPNFYRSETPPQPETQQSMQPIEKSMVNGEATYSSSSSTSSGSMTHNCFSFLAFTAGLAAVTCALASMVGTGWVDTWEPIDLPPVQDWPSLFGTGYGSLRHGLAAGLNERHKSMPTTTSSYETPKTPKSIEELTTEAAVIGESTEKVINESDATADSFVPWSVLHLDDDDDDLQLDYEDYYLLDDPNDIRRLSDSDEDLKKSLIVLFHVGLWRACPFLLRGQLPASVVLPNLPCAGLEYSSWKPLTGKSFNLWRDIQHTPDFLSKVRYATPCIVIGSFISVVALIIALAGPCSSPDRTLVCSSLHILAGLSLGSALIIFVSILNEEFAATTLLRSSRSGADTNYRSFLSQPSSVVSSSATENVYSTYYSDSTSDAGLASVTVMPTFRYGWSFYAAVAAFINAELAAGLYIVLHTHLFKRFAGVPSSVMTRVLASSRRYGVTAVPVTTTKEVGVQTFVEKPRLDSPGALPHTEIANSASVTLNMSNTKREDVNEEVQSFPLALPIPLYVNTASANKECSCQVHYATYKPRPKNSNHVAGIHKASTMPRKVIFAGETNNIYQQTPL